MAAATPKEYNIAGEGTFGIVIKPALPNRNVKYPTNVTKIFKEKSNYNKAIKNANNITRKFSKLKTAVSPYIQSYKIRNLPLNIKKKVTNFINNSNNDHKLHMMRLENLGVSIADIEKSSEKYRRLRTMPYKKICQEIYSCMAVVKEIYDSGYIHGDIRETNVLFNFDTSELNIIDFDWLLPFNEFRDEYPIFFYSHPPECLAIYGRGITKSDPIFILKKSKEYIKSIYERYEASYDIYDIDESTNTLIEFSKRPDIALDISNGNLLSVLYKLFDIAKDFIDSYGLALSINDLLFQAWVGTESLIYDKGLAKNIGGTSTEEEFNKFNEMRLFMFNELIPNMKHSDYTKRWNIEVSMSKTAEKMRALDIDVIEGDTSSKLAVGAVVAAGGAGAVAAVTATESTGLPPSPKSPQTSKDVVAAVSDVIEHIEKTEAPKKSGGARKTQKRRRRT